MTSSRTPLSTAHSSERDRAQTLPDFALGIAIFLVVLAFITVFLPQMTLPYDDTEQPAVAERAVTDLGHHLIADNATTSKLDDGCTLEFFEQNEGEECPFEGEDVATKLGVDSVYSVNVTLRDAPSDGENSAILSCEDWPGEDCENEDGRFAVGETTPQGDRSVVVARRTVFVNETAVVLEVVVW